MLLTVRICNELHRFCQKCCAFHSDLSAFDGSKKCVFNPAVPANHDFLRARGYQTRLHVALCCCLAKQCRILLK